jgi:hypothetical protein|eukprot:COSAG06_NODE_1403_length_9565_cov_3.285231_7_plen_117_part_00
MGCCWLLRAHQVPVHEGTAGLPVLPEGMLHVPAQAGDFLMIPEALTHGALPWLPRGRQRRLLVLRYHPQEKGDRRMRSEILSRLAPETRELTEPMGVADVKGVARQQAVRLTGAAL